MPQILVKSQDDKKRPVGSVVKEYIENVREEVEEEKRELSNQVYKDD